jgi:hypothetical protein
MEEETLNKINLARRPFVGNAAMTLAAARLTLTTSADPQ